MIGKPSLPATFDEAVAAASARGRRSALLPDNMIARRIVNVPMDGLLHEDATEAARAHGLEVSPALRLLCVGLIYHPAPRAVLRVLPPSPIRGDDAPRLRLRLPDYLIRPLNEIAVQHGSGWKAPVVRGLARAWVSRSDRGEGLRPEHVAGWLVPTDAPSA